MFSTPVKGTYPNKTKMNWWDYWIGHCWMTGWQTIRMNFRVWGNLMGSNYEGWSIMSSVDDPEAECLEWFWVGLNEDDVYPKEFLEYLMKMVDDIETGKEKVIPMDENFMNRLKDLTEGVELDYDEEDLKQDMKTLEELMNDED
jgi:hypothetical protein